MNEETKNCIKQAESFLVFREHNCNELKIKLKNKGFAQKTIENTVSFLKNSNELNEERYIRTFIRSNNSRHPEGKSILLARLVQKGADKELSETVLNEIYTMEYNSECILRALEKLKSKNEDKKRIFAKLLAAGFGYSEINRVYNSDIGT